MRSRMPECSGGGTDCAVALLAQAQSRLQTRVGRAARCTSFLSWGLVRVGRGTALKRGGACSDTGNGAPPDPTRPARVSALPPAATARDAPLPALRRAHGLRPGTGGPAGQVLGHRTLDLPGPGAAHGARPGRAADRAVHGLGPLLAGARDVS